MALAPLVLIVEDDPDVRIVLIGVLEQSGYRVTGANERTAGAEIMRALHPDLVIADVRLRGGNGDDLANLAASMKIPILLISGEPEAIKSHKDDQHFLQKPFRLADLEAAVEKAVAKRI